MHDLVVMVLSLSVLVSLVPDPILLLLLPLFFLVRFDDFLFIYHK